MYSGDTRPVSTSKEETDRGNRQLKEPASGSPEPQTTILSSGHNVPSKSKLKKIYCSSEDRYSGTCPCYPHLLTEASLKRTHHAHITSSQRWCGRMNGHPIWRTIGAGSQRRTPFYSHSKRPARPAPHRGCTRLTPPALSKHHRARR